MSTLISESDTNASAPAVLTKQRLDANQALELFQTASFFDLGLMAEEAKLKFHAPEAPVTFVIDSNVNYTNICNVDCLFCAFYRHEGDEDAYVLTYKQISEKAQTLVDAGGTQLLLQGGVNPELPFDFYLDLIRQLRKDFPTLTIHAFSPTEIDFMMQLTGKSLKEVLQQLIDAGIHSIPGGGAEILHDDVRKKVSFKKVKTTGWLDVMEAAHELGLKTTATMMFGMVEEDWHIIDHLMKIRELQDRTGGFTAFIPWTFQKANTKLERLPGMTTGTDYLRVNAMARIMLDNIPNIQASWITQGLKIGQTALCMGANDIGGLLLEENVVTAAGIQPTQKTISEMLKVIHTLGKDAAQRDTAYRILKHYPRP
jgi:cyclic dehypoxanthinyl futalosine synthase